MIDEGIAHSRGVIAICGRSLCDFRGVFRRDYGKVDIGLSVTFMDMRFHL